MHAIARGTRVILACMCMNVLFQAYTSQAARPVTLSPTSSWTTIKRTPTIQPTSQYVDGLTGRATAFPSATTSPYVVSPRDGTNAYEVGEIGTEIFIEMGIVNEPPNYISRSNYTDVGLSFWYLYLTDDQATRLRQNPYVLSVLAATRSIHNGLNPADLKIKRQNIYSSTVAVRGTPQNAFPTPTVSAICQPNGVQQIVSHAELTLLQGKTDIQVMIPQADFISNNWDISYDRDTAVDPGSIITFWQIDNGPETIPIVNGVGGTDSDIKWSNPSGATGTELTLSFNAQQETISFGITLTGEVACNPSFTYPHTPNTNGPTGFHIVGILQDNGDGAMYNSVEVVGSANNNCDTVVSNRSKYGAYGFLGDGNHGIFPASDAVPPSYINSSTPDFFLVQKNIDGVSSNHPLCGITSTNDFVMKFTNTGAFGSFSFSDTGGNQGTCNLVSGLSTCQDSVGNGWSMADLMVCELIVDPSYCASW